MMYISFQLAGMLACCLLAAADWLATPEVNLPSNHPLTRPKAPQNARPYFQWPDLSKPCRESRRCCAESGCVCLMFHGEVMVLWGPFEGE